MPNIHNDNYLDNWKYSTLALFDIAAGFDIIYHTTLF